MQKYLSPAKRYMNRVIPHTAEIKAFVQRRRLMVFGIAAALLLVTMLGFVAVRGRMNSTNNDLYTHEKHADGSSATTTITGGPSDLANGANIPSSSNSSGTKTTVTVNDQPITVPENGSVSKTYTNGDGGTTHVNVSHNSSNSGDNTSSSTTTTTNITTQTYSKDINIQSP